MGVDVSVARGLDVVVLDESGRLVLSRAGQTLPQMEVAFSEVRPDIVAIESPPTWATQRRSSVSGTWASGQMNARDDCDTARSPSPKPTETWRPSGVRASRQPSTGCSQSAEKRGHVSNP